MYFGCSATYLGSWVDLNDTVNFKVASDPTLTSSAKTRRKITATHPNLDGDYLLHSTNGMTVEQFKVWIYGQDQADLASNVLLAESIFDQYDFRMRFTWDNYQETWQCQLSDITIERSQVYAHNLMAAITAQIPRFADSVREEVL